MNTEEREALIRSCINGLTHPEALRILAAIVFDVANEMEASTVIGLFDDDCCIVVDQATS